MRQHSKIASLHAGILMLFVIVPAHGVSLNKSIHVAGGTETGAQSSVNGSISIGEGAVVNGAVETVNGTIRIDENAKVQDAETVNGSIRIASGVTAEDISSVNGTVRLGENVSVSGGVSVVNGRISLDKGTRVAQDLSNVNGEISLSGAEVGGDLSTVNGDVSLRDGSTLRGNLIVEKPSGWGWNRDRRKPKIVIGPGSKVLGNIDVERVVELFISESAEVGGVTGEMSMDDAVRFSGKNP